MRAIREDLLADAFDEASESDADSDLEADLDRLRLQRRLSNVSSRKLSTNMSPPAVSPAALRSAFQPIQADLPERTKAGSLSSSLGRRRSSKQHFLRQSLPDAGSQSAFEAEGFRRQQAPHPQHPVQHRGLMAAAADSSSEDDSEHASLSSQALADGGHAALRPFSQCAGRPLARATAPGLSRGSAHLVRDSSKEPQLLVPDSPDIQLPGPAEATSWGMAEVCERLTPATAVSTGSKLRVGSASRIGVAALWELLESCLLKVAAPAAGDLARQDSCCLHMSTFWCTQLMQSIF